MLGREPGKNEAALCKILAMHGYKFVFELRGWFGTGSVAALDNRHWSPAIIMRVKRDAEGEYLELQQFGARPGEPTPSNLLEPELKAVLASAAHAKLRVVQNTRPYVPRFNFGYHWGWLVHVSKLEEHGFVNQGQKQGGVATKRFLLPRQKRSVLPPDPTPRGILD